MKARNKGPDAWKTLAHGKGQLQWFWRNYSCSAETLSTGIHTAQLLTNTRIFLNSQLHTDMQTHQMWDGTFWAVMVLDKSIKIYSLLIDCSKIWTRKWRLVKKNWRGVCVLLFVQIWHYDMNEPNFKGWNIIIAKHCIEYNHFQAIMQAQLK